MHRAIVGYFAPGTFSLDRVVQPEPDAVLAVGLQRVGVGLPKSDEAGQAEGPAVHFDAAAGGRSRPVAVDASPGPADAGGEQCGLAARVLFGW